MARLYNLDNNHINLVLGIRVDLNESIINLSISKQALILHEQILYESFLDSLKTYAGSKWNQTVTKISDWKDAAVVLGKVISDPQTLNNFSSDVWKKFQKTYLVKFYDLLRKVGLDNLKSKINKFVQSVTNLSGWKKFIAATSISAITKYILDKLSNLNSDGLNAIIEKYFSETALDDILSKLTDFKSYLGWLEPIISGVGILYDVLKNSIDRFKVAFTLTSQTESKGTRMNLKAQLLKTLIREEVKRQLNEMSDSDAVQELVLYAENDSKLYNVLHKTYVPALNKFIKKGNFDEMKALKLLEYYLTNYVRPAYKREFGDDIKLNPADRKAFAKEILDSLKSEGYISY